MVRQLLLLHFGLMIFAQDVAITDPETGAYVSGPYEILLRKGDGAEVARTRVRVDGRLVSDEAGWQSSVVFDFGEDYKRHVIQAEVLFENGDVAESEPVRTAQLEINYQETSRLILVSALVRGRFNRAIERLERDDFRVFENGEAREIATFSREQLPLDIVLLLDSSSSLRGNMMLLRDAATSFVDQLDERDRTALFTFASGSELLSDFTNDRKLMEDHIAGLSSYGETALFDTLLLSLDVIAERNRGRRAIVLFTDGRDSIYEEPDEKARLFRESITRAQNLEVVIFAIGLGKRINQAALRTMAEETGGRYYHADGFGDLSGRFDQVIDDLRNLYVLGIVPASARSGFHELEIKVKKLGAKVYARKGYTIE